MPKTSLEDIIEYLQSKSTKDKDISATVDELLRGESSRRMKGLAKEARSTAPLTPAELEAVTPGELNIARKSAEALQGFEQQNIPEEVAEASKKYKVTPEQIKKTIAKSNVETGSPLNVGEFDAMKQRQFQEQEYGKIFKPVLEKEEAKAGLKQKYKTQIAQRAAEKKAAEAAARAEQLAAESAKYSNIKDLKSPLETNIEALKNLPKSVIDKLSPALQNTLKYGQKIFKPAMKVGGTALGVAAPTLGYLESAGSTQELLTEDDLNWQEQAGKGLKVVGGATAATALPAAIMSGGLGTPIAAGLGITGTTLAGLGSVLDEYGRSINPKYNQPMPEVAPVLAEEKPSRAEIIDVMDKVSESDIGLKRPPVSLIKDYIVKEAIKRGEDPALSLAQIEQESIDFNPNAVSPTGARGLGQHFKDAFTDAQKIDTNGNLKDLSYEEAMKPENWKAQVDAFFDYKKAIRNNWKPKTVEEELRHYNAGSKDSKYYGNEENNQYVKSINQKTKKFEKELYEKPAKEEEEIAMDETNRLPSSVNYTPEEKADALRRVKNFLTAGENVTNLGEENAPLSFGPVPSAEEYQKLTGDQKKLLDLKNKLDYLEGKKQTPAVRPEPQEITQPTSAIPSEQKNIQSIVDEAKQQEDLLALYKKAEEEAESNRAFAGALKGLERVMAGVAGLSSKSYIEPAQVSAFEDLARHADLPLEKFKRDLEFKREDPNSEMSTNMRNFVNQELESAGLQKVDLSGLSYNQLKDIFPSISKRVDKLETAKEKQEKKQKEQSKEDEQKLNDFVTKRGDVLKNSKEYKAFKNAERIDFYIDNALANPNAATDIRTLYDFVKALDNDSAVKEGETKLAMRANGLWGKIDIALKDFIGNPRLLTDDVVKDIKEFAQLAKEKSKSDLYESVSSIEKQVENRIKTSNIKVSPKDVIEGIIPEYQEMKNEDFYNKLLKANPSLKTKQRVKEFINRKYGGDIEAAKRAMGVE